MKRIFLAIVACLSSAGVATAQFDFTINAPNSLVNTTCGAVNNCGFSTSEEHIIRVNIPCAGAWNFSLCGSTFNTKMFLTTAACGGSTLASNDDACGLQSEFTATLAIGVYYVAIEGSTALDCGTYTLVVSDDEAPVIVNCQSDISVNNDAGDCGAIVNFSAPSATDNCVLSSFTSNHNSGELFPVGTTTVNYTATDGGGNVTICSFDITVTDSESPSIINCPSNIVTSNTSGICGANVSWAVPVASDNCNVNSFTTTHSPGATFPLGTTTVIYTATDDAGNSTTCTFTVTVNDTQAPTLICPSNITANNNPGQCGAVVTYSIIGTDNCPGVVTSLTTGLASGSFFPVGTTVVSYLATDAASNTATCSFTVTVIDNEAPVFNCPADLLICGDNSVVTFSIPSFTDNCAGANAVQISGPTSGSTLTVGIYTVSFEAEDAAGNTSTCSYDIVVAYNPVADYGYSTSCAGDLIFFTEFSTIPGGTVDEYSWDMGDGSGLISTRNPVYQFPNTGFYDVTLTVTSDMGCTNSYTETINITNVPSASFIASSQCAGLQAVFNNTSTIITGDLDYVWDFGDGTTGLGDDPVHVYQNPGTYTVILTVTSIDGCVDDFSSTINILANPLANFTTANLQCYGDESGALNITGYGSLSPYTYSLDGGNNYQPTGSFTGLDAGSYTALVEDDNGCSSSYNFTLTEPAELVSTLSNSDDLFCFGDEDGSIVVSTTGGATPYYYTLDDVSFQLSPVFNGLAAGDYVVAVSDDNGCADTVEVTLNEPTDLSAVVFSYENVGCYGNNSGYLELFANGGVSPYQYSINGGQTFQSSPEFNNLAAGTYSIVVKDDNNCSKTFSATITQPEVLAFSVDANDVLCYGGNSGSIVFSVTGGTAPFQFSTNGGQTYGSLSTVTGLASGNYVVSVKDANNCTVSGGAFINQPTQTLSAEVASLQNVLCRSENSGTVTINASGGTETYTYSVDGGQNFQTSSIISGLVTGDYIAIVADFNGCETTVDFSITEPAENLRIDLVVVEDVACSGDGSGLISIIAGGGTTGYDYSINEGTTYQSSNEFEGLGGGTYYLSVRDANGCLVADTAEIYEPSAPLIITFNGSTNVICENDTTGTLNVSGSGGSPPYLYFLDGQNGQLSGGFSGLTSGTYNAQVKDLNGCISSVDVPIDAVSYLPDVDFSYQVAGQSVAFTNLTSGGQAYTWHFGDGTTSSLQSPTHLYATAGQYTVILVAENSCGADSILQNISTIIISVEENELFSTSVYPNPANEQFTVSLTSKENLENIVINLHSVDGRLLFSESKSVQGNSFIRTFNTQHFAQGIYMLELVSDNARSSRLITINH
jgi:PKD repeat protein